MFRRFNWTAHEWLAEVIMATIHSVSGLTGIVLFFAVLLALIHWYLYRILREAIEGHNSLHNYYITCRCDVFQPLARSTSCFLALFDSHLVPSFKPIPIQRPPNFSLLAGHDVVVGQPPRWLHHGFVLLGIYLTGNTITAYFGGPSEALHARQKLRPIMLCIAATALVSLINPIGYKLLLFPFQITADQFVMNRVAEFLSPNFHEVLPFKYMFLAMLVSLAPNPLSTKFNSIRCPRFAFLYGVVLGETCFALCHSRRADPAKVERGCCESPSQFLVKGSTASATQTSKPLNKILPLGSGQVPLFCSPASSR